MKIISCGCFDNKGRNIVISKNVLDNFMIIEDYYRGNGFVESRIIASNAKYCPICGKEIEVSECTS